MIGLIAAIPVHFIFRVIGLIATRDSGLIATLVFGLITTPCTIVREIFAEKIVLAREEIFFC